MATSLPHLEPVTRLSTSIIRVLGGNANKFTLQGTNTYVLGTGSRRMLLDTAQGFDEWKSSLGSVLRDYDHNFSIATCLLSHWHHDHILGIPDLLALSPDVVFHKNQPTSVDPGGQLASFKVPIEPIEDGQRFSDGNGFEVEAVFCPGHTADHMGFLIVASTDESEVGGLFTADNVLGHGTAVFEDLGLYLQSLDVMDQRLTTGAKSGSTGAVRAYPGHGEVIEDARAKIDEYKRHRKMREDEAVNVLIYGSTKPPKVGKEVVPGKEWGSMEMVKVIYADVPEHLHEPAEKGLLMVLQKLKNEGKVTKTTSGKWKLGEKGML